MADLETKVTISADSSQAEKEISKVSDAISKEIPEGVSEASAKVAKEAAAMFAPFIAEMEKVAKVATEQMGSVATASKAAADSSKESLSAVSAEMSKIAQTAKTELGQNATNAIVSAGKRTGEAFTPAKTGMDETAKVAKSKLGGDVVSELDKVAEKARSAIGQDLKNVFGQVSKGLQFAGVVTGIGLAATAVKDVAVAASNTADQMAQIRSRINLINDGSQSTSEIMDKIYSAAQRSRGGYLDMADSVAKLNMLAKDAFSSNDEAIMFVEQLNKQFKISGASVEEASSAMYQLTQAMASGKLQGDEFRSIMENAPMLAQSIATQMGLSVGQLKEMSSQGLITADIIKNALFSSAEETNAKFAEIPMTFAEVGQAIQNDAITAFQPVLEELSNLSSSADLQTFVEGIGTAFRVAAAAAQVSIMAISGAFNGLKVAISTVTNIAKSFGQLFITTMPAVSAAVVGVTTAFIAYRAAIVLCSTQTAALTVAQTALAAKTLILNTATKAAAVAHTAVRVAMAATLIVMGTLTMTTTVLSSGYVALKGVLLGAASAQRILNAVMRANPIRLVISIILGLVAVYATASAAAGGFGATMRSVWDSVVHTAVWGVNKIIESLNWLIAKLNSVGDKVAKFFGGTFTAIAQVDTISAETAQGISDKVANVVEQVTSAMSSPDLDVDTGGGADMNSGGGGKSTGGGKGSNGQDLAKEAKQIHEKILQSYLEMQGKQQELIELQYQKELEELEKSKAANVNYEEDLKNLKEIYADKRIKAKQEEADKIRAIETGIRDMIQDFDMALTEKDSTGSASPMAKKLAEYNDAVDAIEDKYAEMTSNFAKMDAMEQQHYIDELKKKGVVFEMVGYGQIAFEERKNQELLALQRDYNQQFAQMHREMLEEKYAIDEAMRTQNFEALQSALTDEYIAMAQNYELRKQLMTEYQEAAMQSHFNIKEMLFDSAKEGLSQMQEGLSGLLQGTMTLTQAFQNMGKAIVKSISDYIAQWIAAMVRQAVFGKMLQSQQTATSIAAAQAQLPAWSQLAQQMSMATFGASAAAGLAAWSSSTSAGIAQSTALFAAGGGSLQNVTSGGFGRMMDTSRLPKLAEGGLAYGSTFAQIGEGRYQEAVLPLSETVFDRLGEGISNARGGQGVGGSIVLNISAMDSESFTGFLEGRGGQVMRQFLVNQDREFRSTEGAW